MKNKDPLGFDAGLARLARYVPEAQVGEEDDAQARTENKDPGNGGSPQARFLPSPRDPMAVARTFLAEKATDTASGKLKLLHWRGGWWSWRTTHWREAEPRLVRGSLYQFTEHALYGSPDGLELKRWSPNRHKIDDVLDALSSLCFLPNYYDQPTWLDNRESGTIVACKNGLLDVERRELMPHSPSFFNQTSVPFDYEPRARVPRGWRSFLKALWPGDPVSRKTLAAWFGYVASGRLDMQKILLLIGPTRAGKGVIARILAALVGPRNVAGPTLASLAGDFGLAPLIGKPLAVISDARLSGRNGSVVVERLLSISGEDYLTVNVKYKEQWTGRLPCRLFVISNELPEFGDASGAIVNRFIVLTLGTSWLGNEDIELETRLRSQLPGILNWALAGLKHLERRGHFVQPKSSTEAIATMAEMASPIRTFIRDRCEQNPDDSVFIDDLYAAYGKWAELNGHPKIAKSTFGRNLRAVQPKLRVGQPGKGDNRRRAYLGLRLRPEADDES